MMRFFVGFTLVLTFFVAQNVGSYWIITRSSRSSRFLSEEERQYPAYDPVPMRRIVGFPAPFWTVSPKWSKGHLLGIDNDVKWELLAFNIIAALGSSYAAGRWLQRGGERKLEE